jgi:NAD(P)-dependent dehydrogenase (short-subunit alcohol dehydrogenase family)
MSEIALITGGSGDIGKNIAKYIAQNYHYKVYITYNKNDSIKEELKEYNIECIKCDLTIPGDCEKLINELTQIGNVTLLINNAGISKPNKIENMSYEDWNNVISTNLSSNFYVIKNVIKHMKELNKGRIINISSIYGMIGSKGLSNYCASKFGVIGFTKALALEIAGYNITANVICPGIIDAGITKNLKQKIIDKLIKEEVPSKKLVDINNINYTIDLLIKSSSMNGSVITIDEGITC